MTVSTYIANKPIFDSHLQELILADGTGYYDPRHDCYRIVHLSAMVHLGLVTPVAQGDREVYTITEMGRTALGMVSEAALMETSGYAFMTAA